MKASVLLAGLAGLSFTSAAAMPGRRDGQGSKRASSLSGQATTYGGNLNGGQCVFSTLTSLPSGIVGTALSGTNWDSGLYCGACLSVTGPSGVPVTVMVVDECPGCDQNQLDLFPDAWTAIAGANASPGIIDVSWELTSCPITTPLQLHNKDGASQYWFSMQVVGSTEPVQKLEVSTDGGSSWSDTVRKEYNFFENSSSGGFGSTVDVKVTDTNGKAVTVSGVTVSSGSVVTATANF